MVSRETEQSLYRRVLGWLTKYLGRVRELFGVAFRRFGTAPDAHTVFEAGPVWTAAADDIVGELASIAGRHATDPTVQASLDLSRNLIKGVPDEVYRMVIDQIVDGTSKGEDAAQLTQRVDNILSVTFSQKWQGRARTIAVTEANRTWNAGLYSSALTIQQYNGRALLKQWKSSHDDKVRTSHREADGQTVSLSQPFQVGEALLMYPGDPTGPADQVVGCRCKLSIEQP